MRIGYLIAIILFIAAFFAGAAVAGPLLLYWDGVSFLISPLLPFLLCLGSFRPGEIIKSYQAVFSKKPSEPTIMKKGVLYFDTFKNYLIASAVLASLMGLIAVLRNIRDTVALGHGLAMLLSSSLYSVFVIIAIVIPMRATLKKRLEENK